MPDHASNDDRRPSHPARALVLVPIALAVTAGARILDGAAWLPAPLVYGFAGGVALLIGVPLVVWSIEHGPFRLARLMVLGVLAGALPFGLAMVSGLAGLFVRGLSVDYVTWYVRQRVPIPAVGALVWPDFAGLVGEAVIVGTVCALVCWFVLRARRGP